MFIPTCHVTFLFIFRESYNVVPSLMALAISHHPPLDMSHILFLVCFLALAPFTCAKTQSYVPVKAEDILNGTWGEVLRLGEHVNCLSSNISYDRLIPHASIEGRWTVPHSLITMDTVRCGLLSPNATDAQLNDDSRMEYFKFDLISSSRKAARSRLMAPYLHLNNVSRDILTGLEMMLGKKEAGASAFVGWEGSRPRVCGGVRIPLHTFTIFSRIGNQTFPVGDYIKGSEGSTFNLLVNQVYHIMISPAGKNEAERFCPYQTKSMERIYPIRACFPAEVWVRTRDGRRKRMDELKIGDAVEYTDGTGRTLLTHVIMFTHQTDNIISRFVTIYTESGRSIKVTHGHYMDENRKAGDIRMGDRIMLETGRRELVTHIEDTYGKGLYNPQTTSGWINVNGMRVSTYTEAVKPASAHAALSPLRALSSAILFSFHSY